MEYPKGAVKSLEEFVALFASSYKALHLCKNKDFWIASRGFQAVQYRRCTGVITTKKYPDGYEYVGIEYITDSHLSDFSALDEHLLPQTYNDWYVFTSEEDARAYSGVTTTTTTTAA